MCYIIIYSLFLLSTFGTLLYLTPKFEELLCYDGDLLLFYNSDIIKKST